jgi:hypothetical protein
MFACKKAFDLTKHKTNFSVHRRVKKIVTSHFVYGVDSPVNVMGLVKRKEK